MAKEEIIKDFYGRPLGIMITESNGDITIKEFSSRQILGFYRKNRDVTVDLYGRPISQGNTVINLLFTHLAK